MLGYCGRYVATQMHNTAGNIALACNNGRSRSPMYLVAYLIICYDLTPNDARDTVMKLLRSQRGEELDRHDCYSHIISWIYNGNDNID